MTANPRDLARTELTAVLREMADQDEAGRDNCHHECCGTLCYRNPTHEEMIQRRLDALDHRPRQGDICD